MGELYTRNVLPDVNVKEKPSRLSRHRRPRTLN